MFGQGDRGLLRLSLPFRERLLGRGARWRMTDAHPASLHAMTYDIPSISSR
jgi:hypothetical protein